MQFYCPVCQIIIDVEPETTLTTKLGQTAFKAHCPTCKQDLAAVTPTTAVKENVPAIS